MTAKHWSWLLCVMVVSACSSGDSGGPPAMPMGGANGAAGNGGGGAAGAGSGGASGGGGAAGSVATGYRVMIEAERTTICPGQCVELSAEAMEGHPPYRYAWSGDLGDGSGPHEACPEATTTYSVTATDTGSDGEFSHKSEETSASIEIRVHEDCDGPDGGVEPPDGTEVLCSVSIPYTDENWISTYSGWEGNSNIATDDDGNAYIVGAFHGTFTIGSHSITSVGTHDGFVIKYDPSCKPLWVKTFGGLDVLLGFGAVAVGPDGNLAVGGALTGAIDFGQGILASGFNGAAVLLKLDGDNGAALWSQAYASLFYSSSVWDVGIDDAGDIVFSGHAAADVSFGGPAIGGPETANIAYLAKLSSEGAHRFSFPVLNADLLSPFALHPSGVIALTGWSSSEGVTINGERVALSDSVWKRYVAMLDASGELLWGHELEEPEEWQDDQFRGFWGVGVAIDADRNIVVEHGQYSESSDGTVLDLPERISKLDPDGALLWSKDFEDTANDTFYGEGGVTVDTHRNILHSDELADEGAPDAGTPPTNTLHVRKLTPDGDEIWRHVFGDADINWTWGITTAPDDAVWVAHGAEEPTTGDVVHGTLFVTKLAP